jgi:hypothetical protein
MPDTVNIAILLHKSWRTPEGVARVQEIASKLGFTLTTSGRVSLSARLPVDTFKQIFKVTPTRLNATPPGDYDFGSPGGYTTDMELPIPSELTNYVQSISVVPPARRLR